MELSAAPEAEPVPEVLAAAPAEPVATVAPVEVVAEPAAAAPAVAPVVVPAPAAVPADEPPRLSVNRASEAQLSAVKGLSKALAKAIVAGRPYTSLDKLLDIKGLGPKKLEKLRELLKI